MWCRLSLSCVIVQCHPLHSTQYCDRDAHLLGTDAVGLFSQVKDLTKSRSKAKTGKPESPKGIFVCSRKLAVISCCYTDGNVAGYGGSDLAGETAQGSD
jgi:hypothetical protein